MDQKTQTYIGQVHYRNEAGQEMFARAAVSCADRMSFDEALGAHLESENQRLLWSENVFEAIEWFSKFGPNGLVAGLARKVKEGSPVTMSEGKTEASAKGQDENYLIIEEIENVEPLDAQFGVYPKLTVPASLQEAMFGQPEPTESERAHFGDNVPPMGTFAILDAAKMPYLLTGNLENSGLEHQSLFQGDAQEELGDYAPYIVRLEDSNDFTRKLFTTEEVMGLYEKELGIFLRSRATLPELRKHFRKFTRVQDEQGKWYYFRFWEGRVMRSYFVSCRLPKNDPQRFFVAGNHGIKQLFIGSGSLCSLCMSKQFSPETALPFRLDRSLISSVYAYYSLKKYCREYEIDFCWEQYENMKYNFNEFEEDDLKIVALWHGWIGKETAYDPRSVNTNSSKEELLNKLEFARKQGIKNGM